VSLVIASAYTDIQLFDTMAGSPWFTGALSLFLAVMMLINMRMFSLKFASLGWKGNEERWLFVATAVLLFLILRFASLPLIMAAYIIISVVSSLLRRREATAGEA
jgi:CDP-diacylglycerol--serine O-phosphatidyltransferase